jgi:hypothetical protein
MATLEDAARLAMELPGVSEGTRYGGRTWYVGKQGFAWERPLSKADIKRLGDAPAPDGDILAVRVEDLGEKEAVLSAAPRGFFTIAHFDGHPSVLIQLKTATRKALKDAIVDGWLACAPTDLADEFLARRRRRS